MRCLVSAESHEARLTASNRARIGMYVFKAFVMDESVCRCKGNNIILNTCGQGGCFSSRRLRLSRGNAPATAILIRNDAP